MLSPGIVFATHSASPGRPLLQAEEVGMGSLHLLSQKDRRGHTVDVHLSLPSKLSVFSLARRNENCLFFILA